MILQSRLTILTKILDQVYKYHIDVSFDAQILRKRPKYYNNIFVIEAFAQSAWAQWGTPLTPPPTWKFSKNQEKEGKNMKKGGREEKSRRRGKIT